MFKHVRLPVGPLQCNCQILACPETHTVAIVDPGDEAPRILEKLFATTQLPSAVWLLHTHAHFDHVGATRLVAEALRARSIPVHVALHRADAPMYAELKMQGQMFGLPQDDPIAITHWLEDGEALKLGTLELDVLHTPGHSPGGLCFRWGNSKVGATLFSGDTLFDHSVGRTDLWEGDWDQLKRSIRERIFTLDDETQVVPGHGSDTSVGVEKRENPFLT